MDQNAALFAKWVKYVADQEARSDAVLQWASLLYIIQMYTVYLSVYQQLFRDAIIMQNQKNSSYFSLSFCFSFVRCNLQVSLLCVLLTLVIFFYLRIVTTFHFFEAHSARPRPVLCLQLKNRSCPGCCMVFYGVRICLDTDCPKSLSTIQIPRICEN